MFGAALLVQAVTGRVTVIESDEVDCGGGARSIGKAVSIVIAVPIYVALAQHLGFVIAMFVVAVGVMLCLRVRLSISIVVVAVIVPLVSYLFGTVLRVPLPVGPFGW
jgi:cell division protein FtsW (lipid II flippase)